MSWVNQYHVGDSVQIMRVGHDSEGAYSVVAVVDPSSHGILVHVDIGGGERHSRAFFKETDVRRIHSLAKRPISPIFYPLQP